MKKLFCASFLICIVAVCVAAEKPSSLALPRSTPEKQGVSSSAILAFVETADQKVDAMHSFMLVRHGKVIAEGWWSPYDSETRHSLYSLSKSFTSTAVGLAAEEGKLSIDDEVLKFFPEDAPADSSANLKSMRIRDLLRMSTGQQTEPSLSTNQVWTKTFLSHLVPFKPGTHFVYNTAATYMLSAMVQKATGMPVLDYLRPRLFDPLGIEGPTWGTSPQGITLGGYGLSVRTEDIAKFGQLYLQKGKWNGHQLIPARWVAEATTRQTSNGSNPKSDWDQGYGYQFWRCRNGAYRGDGAFGQYCVVMPDQDAVLAITSGTRDMQNVLNIVWDKLFPAMQNHSLTADSAAQKKLEHTLTNLKVRPAEGSGSPGAAAKFAGKKFVFPSNGQKIESASLEFGNGSEVTLVLQCNGVEQRVVCGNGAWKKSRMSYGVSAEQPVAASGAWTGDGIFTVKFSFYETPFLVTANLKFSGDELTYDAEDNVAFGPAKKPQIVGHPQ